jgi:hypothetical protein
MAMIFMMVCGALSTSWPGHSRPKDGIASLAYVPAIDVLIP